ncbi:MAG: 23S rRNA (adenine(2503)-C(2))-methyltransferase RlmN [Bacteroidales bacterium]
MKDESLNTPLVPLLGMTLEQLKEAVTGLKMPAFTAKQLAQWIYEKGAKEIDDITNLSKKNRELLQSVYTIGAVAPISADSSEDGTIKYLFSVGDGKVIESVYIPTDDRATLCISSQVGCKMGCEFCMTGKLGFNGNLTSGQIINQLISIPEFDKITNIVFMGMGEPLDNLAEVKRTIEIMTSDWGLAWSPKRITVSTIGKLKELQDIVETTKVHIAVSVHNAIGAERAKLMPSERAFPIKSVFQLLKDYDFFHQRRLSIEYIMWDGVNDTMAHADELVKLISGEKVRVNLIRFHAIPNVDLTSATEAVMVKFRDYLNSRGVISTIRRSRGEDIMAACGMLAGKKG